MEVPLAAVIGLINASTGRLVQLVAQALETGVWAQAGIRSPEHWLAWKGGVSLGRARRLVTLARRSLELPVTTAALAAGELSEDQAVEVALHVPPAHDAEVASLARHATVSQIRTVARRYTFQPAPTEQDEPAPLETPEEVVERNLVRFGFGDDGRWWCHADLDAALGALVQRALEACRDAELADRHPAADANGPATAVTWGEALVRLGSASLAGLAGGRSAGDQHQVILHVRADEPSAPTHLHLGPALPAAVRREVGCDATVRWLLEDAEGIPIKLGRRQRTFSAAQRILIEDRYGGECARPGCQRRRGLHLHHHRHWEDGGLTDLDNAFPLCGADHRLHHRGLLGIEGDPARPESLVFTDHHGRVLTRGAEPSPPDARRPLAATGRDLGLCPAQWLHPSGERLDRWSVHFADPPDAA
ncbi:MAG: 13E12 repeat family protein [Actinomycetota bacterium]|nr:13E12 repeat family protein [Actinomycetota bacterium]